MITRGALVAIIMNHIIDGVVSEENTTDFSGSLADKILQAAENLTPKKPKLVRLIVEIEPGSTYARIGDIGALPYVVNVWEASESEYEYAMDGLANRKEKTVIPWPLEVVKERAQGYNPPRKVYRRALGEWEEVEE